MGVEIHSRALVAMDHLEPAEREVLLRALDSFAAGMASGGVSPHTALESNGLRTSSLLSRLPDLH